MHMLLINEPFLASLSQFVKAFLKQGVFLAIRLHYIPQINVRSSIVESNDLENKMKYCMSTLAIISTIALASCGQSKHSSESRLHSSPMGFGYICKGYINSQTNPSVLSGNYWVGINRTAGTSNAAITLKEQNYRGSLTCMTASGGPGAPTSCQEDSSSSSLYVLRYSQGSVQISVTGSDNGYVGTLSCTSSFN